MVNCGEDAHSDNLRKGYSQFSQRKVTRSGRRVFAAKAIMFDTGIFMW